MTLKLSVLDQSFTRTPAEAPIALQETLQMAQWCEELDYERFWVSEHHGFNALAGSAPEVLLAALGAATKTIRIGSGGIMLPHYSAYKIAEVFSLLANLYPERIDLGIGRAPGADMSTARALATDGKPKFERFPALVNSLIDYLSNPNCKPKVSPKPPANLPVWMLGSSADSAQLAAQSGLPYNLGLFINADASPALTEAYQAHFSSSDKQPEPYTMITIGVFCAETEALAKASQMTYDINFYRFITGQSNGHFLSPQEAQLYPVDSQLKAFINSRSHSRAIGTQEQVKAKIAHLAKRFKADEVMAVTNMYYFEDRKRSFELLKGAFS